MVPRIVPCSVSGRAVRVSSFSPSGVSFSFAKPKSSTFTLPRRNAGKCRGSWPLFGGTRALISEFKPNGFLHFTGGPLQRRTSKWELIRGRRGHCKEFHV